MTSYDIDDLVAKAKKLVDEFQPELALKFYEKALEQEPDNTNLLDAIAEIHLELQGPEMALEAFQKSIHLAPSNNPVKYLYVAQLLEGENAAEYTLEGIKHLIQEHEELGDNAESATVLVVRKQICEAFCSLSELYTTDLCDMDDAEEKCEFYLNEAFKYDVGLPEPTQGMANLRLIQNKKDEALKLLDETYTRISNCDDDNLPGIEFRMTTGKLLIEVEKFEEAVDVLERVMQEDDENPELWFLVGFCYHKMEDNNAAIEYLDKSRTMLEALKKQMGKDFYLQDQIQQVEQMIENAKKGLFQQIEEEPEPMAEDSHEMELS